MGPLLLMPTQVQGGLGLSSSVDHHRLSDLRRVICFHHAHNIKSAHHRTAVFPARFRALLLDLLRHDFGELTKFSRLAHLMRKLAQASMTKRQLMMRLGALVTAVAGTKRIAVVLPPQELL